MQEGPVSEISITGANPITYPQMASWEWQVPVYLFIGGLVAGLMIFAAIIRLRGGSLDRRGRFSRAIRVADWASLPLLAAGLFMLWLDLANRWNAWRFFATFQIRSPMSWGSWILLVTMFVLAVRIAMHLRPWQPGPSWLTPLAWLWNLAARIGGWLRRRTLAWDVITILLGIGLGAYTGLLLSTIPARPLWNSAVLAPLFLVSGLASGAAFLFFFVSEAEHKRLLPAVVGVGVVELALLAGYFISLRVGEESVRQASGLLLNGSYAWGFWGLVVLLGVLVPLAGEGLEIARRPLPRRLAFALPLFTLIGGVALRFVVVYAGLLSHV